MNPVNCVGVMGKGIALQFKQTFPDNFKAYQQKARQNGIKPGSMFTFQLDSLMNPKYIINFPTKRHWRSKSLLSDIQIGLEALVKK